MSRKTSFALRATYAICLLGAACTHLATFWRHGIGWDYGGAPLFTRAYWTSLTLLDPMAALLLFVRPRAGLVLTAAIIASDVLHNTLVGVLRWDVRYLSQVAFSLFVACTVRLAWKGTRPPPQPTATLPT